MKRTRRQWLTYRLIEEELRNYPESKKQLEEMRQDIIESRPEQSAVSEKSARGKPTETTAIRLMSSRKLMRYERVVEAIEHVLNALDDVDMKLVELQYFQGKCRLFVIDELFQGAHNTYNRHKNMIIKLIADRLGYDVGN